MRASGPGATAPVEKQSGSLRAQRRKLPDGLGVLRPHSELGELSQDIGRPFGRGSDPSAFAGIPQSIKMLRLSSFEPGSSLSTSGSNRRAQQRHGNTGG
jgi:hypothetical protein